MLDGDVLATESSPCADEVEPPILDSKVLALNRVLCTRVGAESHLVGKYPGQVLALGMILWLMGP